MSSALILLRGTAEAIELTPDAATIAIEQDRSMLPSPLATHFRLGDIWVDYPGAHLPITPGDEVIAAGHLETARQLRAMAIRLPRQNATFGGAARRDYAGGGMILAVGLFFLAGLARTLLTLGQGLASPIITGIALCSCLVLGATFTAMGFSLLSWTRTAIRARKLVDKS